MTKKEMKEAERLEAKEKKDAAKQEAKEKKALEKQEAKERKAKEKAEKTPCPKRSARGRGRGDGRGRGGRGASTAMEPAEPAPSTPKSTTAEVGTPDKINPKRKHAMVATPKQKEMVKKRREAAHAAASQGDGNGSSLPAQDGLPPPVAPRVENDQKCKDNLQLMLNCGALFSEHKLPGINEGKKSFTLHSPHNPDEGSSIGVILSSGSFYIYKAYIPNVMHLQNQYGEGTFHTDKKGGVSLGWNRCGDVDQASLDPEQCLSSSMSTSQHVFCCQTHFK